MPSKELPPASPCTQQPSALRHCRRARTPDARSCPRALLRPARRPQAVSGQLMLSVPPYPGKHKPGGGHPLCPCPAPAARAGAQLRPYPQPRCDSSCSQLPLRLRSARASHIYSYPEGPEPISIPFSLSDKSYILQNTTAAVPPLARESRLAMHRRNRPRL